MNNTNFQQIVCTSSQKSIITGLDGFGVRTKSASISDIEADEIYYKSGLNYQLPADQMATEEIIAQNPDLDKMYPNTYIFRDIILNNGTHRYIVARTLYVGIDYGYFAQIDSARRAGTNYLSHILIFEELPTFSTISAIVNRNLFVPHNTLCSPDNKELCSFLVGEPALLNDGKINNTENNFPEISIEFGCVIIALLEWYKNTKVSSVEPLKKVACKITQDKIKDLIQAIGTLPTDLTNGLYFLANPSFDSHVPDWANLLIVNENSQPIANNDNIIVDLLGNKPKMHNIETNYLYKQIIEWCKNKESKTIQKIIQVYLTADFNYKINYQDLCLMMDLMYSNQGITIHQIDINKLKQIASHNLKPKQSATVWKKINNAINEVFDEASDTKDIQTTLQCIGFIYCECPDKLELYDESCNFIIDTTFNRQELAQIIGADQYRLEGVLCAIRQGKESTLPNEEIFFNTLKTTNSQTIWEKFIKQYYGNSLRGSMDSIIMSILQSEVAHKDQLVKTLFPVEKYAADWLGIINDNLAFAKSFPSILTPYFVSKMEQSPNETMRKYLSINKGSLDLLKDADKITNAYLNVISKDAPTADKSIVINIVKQLNIPVSTKKKCAVLYAVLTERDIPSVGNATMSFALKICKNKEYLLKLFETWMDSKPEVSAIVSFVDKACDNAEHVAKVFETYYNKNKSQDNILKIADQIKWSKSERKAVVNYINNDDLKEILTQNGGFLQKIFRKLGFK